MDEKTRLAKLKMWQDQLKTMEKELEAIYEKKAVAAQEGDLRENAAYQMAVEDAETWRVRIQEVKKIIFDLEGGDSNPKAGQRKSKAVKSAK